MTANYHAFVVGKAERARAVQKANEWHKSFSYHAFIVGEGQIAGAVKEANLEVVQRSLSLHAVARWT